MAEASDELLTVEEVARLLKVNPASVRNWIDSQKLPALRVGERRVRIQRSALDTFIGARTQPDLTRRTRKRDVPLTPDADAAAAALDEIGNGFLKLAEALRREPSGGHDDPKQP